MYDPVLTLSLRSSSRFWAPSLPTGPALSKPFSLLIRLFGGILAAPLTVSSTSLGYWGTITPPSNGVEKTAQEIRLARDSSTGGYVLTAKLLNLKGECKDAAIKLDENLKVEEYVDAGTNETYHCLTERHRSAPERTLVLCFDGTSNEFSEKITNVINLMVLLKKDDPSKQMVYYQTGVGTYSPPGLTTSIGLAAASTANEAVAYMCVIDGYRYLAQTYIADRIALFGFSRGAFTARAVAGMLHRAGLLPRHNAEHMPKTYEIYSSGTDADAQKFQRLFSVLVKVEFVGVWDTVASVEPKAGWSLFQGRK